MSKGNGDASVSTVGLSDGGDMGDLLQSYVGLDCLCICGGDSPQKGSHLQMHNLN